YASRASLRRVRQPPTESRSLQRGQPIGSCDDLVKDVARHIGEAEIAPAVAIGQLGVIDAEQMEDGGVKVVDVDRLLDRLETEIVGRAVNLFRFSAPAPQPTGSH